MLDSIWSAVAGASMADWLLLAAGGLLALYVAGTWNYDFFKRRGIPSTKPSIPFVGDIIPMFIGIIAFPDLLTNLYNKGKGHSVVGFFEFTRPIFMIRDPQLVKEVSVKEFDHFMNHRSVTNEKSDPIFSRVIFNLKDQRWKNMRTTLSPAFTTSKIKAMFPLIRECTSQMADHLRKKYSTVNKESQKSLEVDMKDLFTRMANDVIATVAFGVACNSQQDTNNEFYGMGKEVTTFKFFKLLVFVAYMIAPKLAEALRLSPFSERACNYFHGLVHETIRERQAKDIFRPDMLQLLMQARAGQLKAEAGDEHEEERHSTTAFQISDNDITAQAVIFFFAGFETVSTVLCFTSLLLAQHPEVQEQLQHEVDEMIKETGGKPTYEAVQGMKYLDAVISESMRMYPAIPSVDRVCQEETVLPPTGNSGPIHIRKDDIVWLPVFALHHDPEHWPEPDVFRPERFMDENKNNIKPFTYVPFGAGPRICIGQRFALLEVKLALVHLVANFNLQPSPKTKMPLEFETGGNITARGGFWNLLIPRNV